MEKVKKIYHHYCLIRDDLPIGVIAAQLVHAAGESNPEGKKCHSVVLSTNKLEDVESMLRSNEILHTPIREPNSPYNGELLAIGVNPCVRDQSPILKNIMKKLTLLGKKDETKY